MTGSFCQLKVRNSWCSGGTIINILSHDLCVHTVLLPRLFIAMPVVKEMKVNMAGVEGCICGTGKVSVFSWFTWFTDNTNLCATIERVA